MEKRIKQTFGKIEMEERRKAEIRQMIAEKAGKSEKKHSWLRHAVCAAACMALLLALPSTRTGIVQAADYFVGLFHTANGSEIIYEENDHERTFTFEVMEEDYLKVQDGRLYLTVGEECIDVTDRCSEDTWYRYEIANEDGGKNVILVGGTVEAPGWVELVFDADGNYVFNQMQVGAGSGENTSAWVNAAMHSEGVPCGDPELDRQLEE